MWSWTCLMSDATARRRAELEEKATLIRTLDPSFGNRSATNTYNANDLTAAEAEVGYLAAGPADVLQAMLDRHGERRRRCVCLSASPPRGSRSINSRVQTPCTSHPLRARLLVNIVPSMCV